MSLRTYSVDGKKATFNKAAYLQLVKQKSREEKISITKVAQMLAEKLNVAYETVHKWIYNGGGPIDYSTTKRLAEILNAPAEQLLSFIDEGENMAVRLTEARQLAAVKRIYDNCIWFLDEFAHTNGFNDYWYDFHDQGAADPEEELYKFVDDMHRKINLVLDQEYFDLRNCEIYSELDQFINEELYEIYNGKLGYAYRFEAIPEGNPTTHEDYTKAMIRLNTIIDKYT